MRAGRRLTDADLAAVRERRRFPTAVTQRLQRIAQSRFVDPLLHTDGPVRAPLPLRVLRGLPALQGVAARLVGLGVRPEHVI